MQEQKAFMLRINCGSDQDYIDSQGRLWISDKGVVTGEKRDHGPVDIVRTDDSTIYRADRCGAHYLITVPNGSYTIVLHFCENDSKISAEGQRLFDAYVQGRRIPDIDIFKETGWRSRALVKKIQADVTNGKLRITFTSNANPALINAIEVLSTDAKQPPVTISSPNNLLAASGDGIVLLKWSTAQGADYYNIKRITPGTSGYVTIASNVIGNKFIDSGLANGVTYKYAVSAIFLQGESSNSPQIEACPRAAELQPWSHLPGNVELDMGKGQKMQFVLIPPGQFIMGSPVWERYRARGEEQHMVTITKPFYMGLYEVTQAQYEAVMGYNPSHPVNIGEKKPVDTVSYTDAVEYCNRVSGITGRHLRLPTESEFEYALRAGSTDAYFFGNGTDKLAEYCWYSQGRRISSDVGILKPNPFGLYDINGNVWEWVSDWYKPEYENDTENNIDPAGPKETAMRNFRGGCAFNDAAWQRCASRHPVHSDYTDNAIGMRLVLDDE